MHHCGVRAACASVRAACVSEGCRMPHGVSRCDWHEHRARAPLAGRQGRAAQERHTSQDSCRRGERAVGLDQCQQSLARCLALARPPPFSSATLFLIWIWQGGVVGQQIAAVPVRCVVESVHNNNAPAAAAAAAPRCRFAPIPILKSLTHPFQPSVSISNY